jgi:hypothetical protein
MSVKVGKIGSVKLGTYDIAEMGVWSLSGMTNEMLEHSKFGDEEKEFEFGIADYGTISFNGHFDMSDTNGQKLLESAHMNKSKITNDLKFYIDNTSYYTVDVTNNSASAFLMQTITIGFDKSGIGTISFQVKVSGKLVLV